ncbi:SusC/RagA family TonB-linked outer membrane protein [Chitinophaga sancti]|uniref:Iron complex outermembrane recepter protein n=1 Tax=Chitinophaga sancti TaxID=1004 RepID=A0A1K1NXU1_9BACT|nr:SusC/RagA family TonB-linked outer membrane protein [Chitinophaga sancti]WQD60303.1 SusC/RagA family TonB-linked outer membrane protein [Chitinophaga sancti]WQG87569.1 SusC/RagA family TonB-linked outer membrane protein [Chitinophaga sancti]SFW40338.1 iron complex outermembrane recepter protein [Chitinophaga sancti]
MTTLLFCKVRLICLSLLLIAGIASAQNRPVTGKITDENGSPVPGATIQVKGTSTGTTAIADGTFKLSVPPNGTTLVISFIGYNQQEVAIAGKSQFSISLVPSSTTLTDVVVVGYGTTRKKDLTGSVVSIKSADFNKGIVTAPDQLILGKVAGLMVMNNSGAPGGATTVRIRGNSSVRTGNQPLYVVDGMPLDGRTAKPSVNANGLGQTPDANPLNFINSFDIQSMDVLKDASATAIYGARGANGVVIITTKKGQSGPPKLDLNYSAGASSILKKLDVLDAAGYRSALKQYNLTAGDEGSSVDPMNSILRTGITHNVNVGLSGGNDNGVYRASFGMLDQQGIVKKTGLRKYTANLNGQFKLLDNQRIGVDYSVQAAHTTEQIAPITNDAGFTGSLIGQALQWNPTLALRKADGSFNILGKGSAINPEAMSAAYDDDVNVNSILANISPYIKITDDLEYRFVYSINHQVGERETQIASFINIPNVMDNGQAYYGVNTLTSQLFTHTLNYNKQVTKAMFLSAVVGYESQQFNYKGRSMGGLGFSTDALKYVDILQNPIQTNTFISSFRNPKSELQSFFGRANLNFFDKYLLTATLRADGSSKFGENNKYGYFPSFAAKWNIANEAFLKDNKTVSQLSLRVGWGITGNQEFPAGAAQEQYTLNSNGGASLSNVANPNLKWESSKQLNAGIDYAFFNGRLYGSVDYFNKNTTNLLFNFPAIQPAPASNYWINLPANVINKGFEIVLRGDVVATKDFTWDLGVNATFLRNELKNYDGPPVLTGSISGQGASNAYAQRLVNNMPLNSFYVRQFEGFDDNGQGIYKDNGNSMYFLGQPNPKTMMGIITSVNYKSWTLGVNMHGAFGFDIYNNTANTVLPIGNLGSRNIAAKLVGSKEALSNPITVSSRYLEKGNFMKMDNITLSYKIGNIGKVVKGASIYLTGQNLFIITKYTGFDPEVNTDKNINGVTSMGIEYSPYPTARSILAGINFSL